MVESKLLDGKFYCHTQIGEDYHNLCRLCLTKTSLKLNMCLEEGRRRDIQGKMLNCLSLIVTEDDSLPQCVCYLCVDKLENFQDFHNMCHESEKLLQEYLSSAGENHRRKSSFEKPSAYQSYGSKETVAAGVSDTGCHPLEVLTKSETESPDPLVCEQTPLENTWPYDQPYVKTETISSLVPPYVDTSVDIKPFNECIPDASIDSKLFIECMEETSVCKVGTVNNESWMHLEDTTQEVPVGQDVPAEDSDNDALILRDDEDRKNSEATPDQVEDEVADPVERHKNKNNMEFFLRIKDISRSDSHLPSLLEELKQTSEQEQPNNNLEWINEQELLEPVPTNKSFCSKIQNIYNGTANNKKKQYICSLCNKYFACRAHLIVHTHVHGKERPFKCPICKKIFFHKKGVNVHMRVHTKGKPFNCSICNKSFIQKGSLSEHLRVHTQERHFNCSICNKGFVQKGNLKVHMRFHTKEKPFHCSTCNKGFALKEHLILHIRVHTKEKPFNCSICNRSFSQRGSLTAHMRVHTKEKPFQCFICHKDFALKSNFNQHMRVHTKERPFNCSVCKKDFAHKHHLTLHMRVHTKVMPSCKVDKPISINLQPRIY